MKTVWQWMWILPTFAASVAWADDPPISWQTGAEVERTLAQTTSIDWTDQTLPAGFRSLETTYRIPIVRDRRIDPRQRLTVSAQDESLDDAIAAAAAAADRDITAFPWGIYVGPRGIGDRAATSAALRRKELEQAQANERRRMTRETPASWPRLSQPRQLIETIADDYQIQVEGIDSIPYDLWDGRELPDLDFVDRISLVLASFDLTFRWVEAGKKIQLIPLPEAPRFEDSYPVAGGRTPPLTEWKSDYPNATFVVSGNRIEVNGTWGAHRDVRRWLADRKKPSPGNAPTGERRFTLRIQSATLAQITDYLAKQLELEFVWSTEAEAQRETRTMLEVQDATLDEMLKSVFQDSGLSYRVDGKRVLIDIAP